MRVIEVGERRDRALLTVHPEHEPLVRHWIAEEAAHGDRFVMVVVFTPFILLALVGLAALLNRQLIVPVIGLAIVALAAFMARFPFPTPQTVQLLGLRRSLFLVRVGIGIIGVIGLAMIAASAWQYVTGM